MIRGNEARGNAWRQVGGAFSYGPLLSIPAAIAGGAASFISAGVGPVVLAGVSLTSVIQSSLEANAISAAIVNAGVYAEYPPLEGLDPITQIQDDTPEVSDIVSTMQLTFGPVVHFAGIQYSVTKIPPGGLPNTPAPPPVSELLVTLNTREFNVPWTYQAKQGDLVEVSSSG